MLVSSWKPQSNPPRAMSGNRGSLIPGFEATFPLDLSMVDQHGALQIRLKLLHSERSEGRTAQKAKTAGIHRSDFEHDWKLLNHIFYWLSRLAGPSGIHFVERTGTFAFAWWSGFAVFPDGDHSCLLMWRLGQVQRFLDASALIVSSPAFCMRGWRQLGRPGPSCAAFGNPNGGKSEKRDEKRELSSLTCFYYFGMNHILADFWYRGLRGYLEHWHLVVVWTPADWQVVCGSHRNWVARTCRGICSTGFRHIPTPVQQLHSRYICRISSRALDRGAFPGNDIDMVDQCGSWLVYNSQRGCQQCDLVKTCKR